MFHFQREFIYILYMYPDILRHNLKVNSFDIGNFKKVSIQNIITRS